MRHCRLEESASSSAEDDTPQPRVSMPWSRSRPWFEARSPRPSRRRLLVPPSPPQSGRRACQPPLKRVRGRGASGWRADRVGSRRSCAAPRGGHASPIRRHASRSAWTGSAGRSIEPSPGSASPRARWGSPCNSSPPRRNVSSSRTTSLGLVGVHRCTTSDRSEASGAMSSTPVPDRSSQVRLTCLHVSS